MAIYSCNLRSIGRTTHAEGTAGAHLRYIGRQRAASEILSAHIPASPAMARTWMDGRERTARKNARLCDKIRVALPRELDARERAALVQAFMADLTSGGRVPWLAAIHQTGRDAHNPHAHIVVVDSDIETGKRLLHLSAGKTERAQKNLPGPSAAEWVRERWEHHANAALERAGHDARIDRRTLAAQGIERTPQIHIGPRAQHIDCRVHRPVSKEVPCPTPRHPERVIDYPMIDAGRTRRERNAEIIDLNLERASRSQDFETRLYAQFEKDQRAKDRPVEAMFVARARRRSLDARRLRARYRERRDDVRARERAEAALARAWLAQRHAPEIEDLRRRHESERRELDDRQGAFFSRFVSMLDITGGARRRRETDRRALRRRQREERLALSKRIRQARETHRMAVEARYAVQLGEVARDRSKALQSLTERHRREELEEDQTLQRREAEREEERREIEARLDEWKRGLKAAAAREKAHGKGVPPPPPEPPVNKWEPGKKKAPRRTKRTNERRSPRPPDGPAPPEPPA